MDTEIRLYTLPPEAAPGPSISAASQLWVWYKNSGQVILESGRTYGSPRVCEELKKRGVPCSREHVAYLREKHGLRSRHYKRPRGLTQVDRCRKAAPNLVDQYFEVDRPNSIWMADITYIPTGEGWLYLAAVMDLCTRKVVGWSLKDTLETETALEAFDRAAAVENPEKDLIHTRIAGCSTAA